VLRPGGLVVLADSCQLGDRPAWDPTLGSFGNFNEPHYRCHHTSVFTQTKFNTESWLHLFESWLHLHESGLYHHASMFCSVGVWKGGWQHVHIN
jgi:hypothetical protein